VGIPDFGWRGRSESPSYSVDGRYVILAGHRSAFPEGECFARKRSASRTEQPDWIKRCCRCAARPKKKTPFGDIKAAV